MSRFGFYFGQPVEVVGTDYMLGSFYEAAVNREIGGLYVEVIYTHRAPMGVLRSELIPACMVRPTPRRIHLPDVPFNVGEDVDFPRDHGWWHGRVRVVHEKMYCVASVIDQQDKWFHHEELRCHQEWIVDRWAINPWRPPPPGNTSPTICN